MTLPAFLRHFMARLLVQNGEEMGGQLHDYNNGKWSLLQTWEGVENQDAMQVLESGMTRGRDEIYVSSVRVVARSRAGYFVMFDSDINVHFRWFWEGVYEPDEAFYWIVMKCRESAKRMGYRQEPLP